MRIAIIGATGFIGRGLANYLISKGERVTVFTRHLGHAKNVMGKDFQYALWDGQSVTALTLLAAGQDVIINLAGENISSGRWTKDKKQTLYNSRISPAKALAEAVQKATKRPSVVVQVSATGIYGPSYDGTPDSVRNEGFLSLVCNDWEEAVRPAESEETRLIIMRMAVVLGKNEGMLAKLAPIFKAFGGGHMGNGHQWLPWIHQYDIGAAAYHLIYQENARGVYDFAAPETVNQRTFFQTLGKVLNKPSWLHIPSAVIKLVFGEMGQETLLASQKVYPHRLLESGYQFHYPTLDVALNDIYK